jgi:PKD repeat protein
MKAITRCFPRVVAAFCVAGGFAFSASAQNLTLRIVCYNIEDDITNATFDINATTPLPGLIFPYAGGSSTNGSVTNGGVLEGIGEEILGDGVAQPIDILALEETTSNPATVAPIVAGLNAFYGLRNPLQASMYAMSTYQATEGGGTPTNGNGPNALVYNTKTVQLLASVPVDPPGGIGQLGSGSGEYREVMRYEFAPAGQAATTATEFYIYVSHYKSTANGSQTNDEADREGEAVIIRNNEAASLSANARVLYTGDYNIDTSSEASYQTILAPKSPGGITQGQGIDPLNTNAATNIDWTANSLLNEKTEEDFSLHYRLDFQVSTSNVFNAVAGGLALVPGTYHAFGNNGSVAYENSLDDGANTALNGDLAPGSPISAPQLYLDMIGASDHLPVVADYTIPVVQPKAVFTVSSPTTALPPLTVTFADASTGIITNWFWNFGDGATSNTSATTSVTHTYTSAGVYSAAETVTGPGGTNLSAQTTLITILTPFQAWQLQYFGCTNCSQAQPGTDADGTGQDNLFKYVAGLDPTNPASVFAFNVVSVPSQLVEKNLVFGPVAAGRSYTPLFSTNLLNGPWAPLTTTAAPPVTNGAQVTITDTNATQPQKYYQIEISGP